MADNGRITTIAGEEPDEEEVMRKKYTELIAAAISGGRVGVEKNVTAILNEIDMRASDRDSTRDT